jgi:fructan beta-fructosidase
MPASRLNRSLLACSSMLALSLAGAQTIYEERYRPQVHFSPRQNWTNDPNGLVYFHGEYHLFFQFNPLGDEWGHMSWGHAVSTDLLHWRELHVALPEKDDEMAFTGSVVVDTKNTSGFCAPGKECLVAIYTGNRQSPQETRQTQNLAYSVDDGRTWIRYARNPVLDLQMADFRDPSVSWDDQEGHWRMAISLPTEHKIRFYASPDLKHWTPLSDFGPAGDVDGGWECPDLLSIPAESGDGTVWALKVGLNPGAPQGGSGEQYFLGHFDGKRFTVSDSRGAYGWMDYGKDDYCAISFNGLPRGEKPVVIGWMSNWQYAAQLPTSPWRGQMTLPRRLSLHSDQAGLAIKQEPLSDTLHTEHAAVLATHSGTISNGIQKPPFELDLQFGQPTEQAFGVRIYHDEQHWTEIGFDRLKLEFYIDRTKSGDAITPDFLTKTIAPLAANRPYDLKIVVDRSSVEAYAQNGTITMTNLIFPSSENSRLALFSASGKQLTVKGDVWKLSKIWK